MGGVGYFNEHYQKGEGGRGAAWFVLEIRKGTNEVGEDVRGCLWNECP